MTQTYNILGFGIAKDIFGSSVVEISLEAEATVEQLRKALEEQYFKLKKLSSYMVAINETYATDDSKIGVADEIAIIPPVSGG